jgi:hypothetical protein
MTTQTVGEEHRRIGNDVENRSATTHGDGWTTASRFLTRIRTAAF